MLAITLVLCVCSGGTRRRKRAAKASAAASEDLDDLLETGLPSTPPNGSRAAGQQARMPTVPDDSSIETSSADKQVALERLKRDIGIVFRHDDFASQCRSHSPPGI